MKHYYYIAFFLVLLISNTVTAQTDTLFWFAPPDISNDHDHSDEYIEIRLANSDSVPVTVSISQPANPASPINANFQSITIPAGEAHSINLSSITNGTRYKTSLETVAGQIRNTGLLIESSGFITAYYEVGRATSVPDNQKLFADDTTDKNGEIFTLKGRNALGTHFFTPFQNEYHTHDMFADANSSFDIVATEDNTKISFFLTRNGQGSSNYGADVWHNDVITLDKGQTYSVNAAEKWATTRMTGSQIKSDKPIAVTLKDDSPKSHWDTGADLIGDQLIPVNIAGKEYVVVRGFLGTYTEDGDLLNDKSQVFIVPTENNTTVQVFGPQTVTYPGLNQGQTQAHFISSQSANSILAERIVADKPIYVYYVSGYGSEMGGPVLPPIKCTGSSRVTFVRSNEDPFYLTVISRQDAIGGYTITPSAGAATSITAADFSYDAGDGWLVAQKRMDQLPVGEAITVTNSINYFHLGIINGEIVAGTSRFGYFSDYGQNSSELPELSNICPGTSISLDPKLLAIDPNLTFWYKSPDLVNEVHTGITLPDADTGKYVMKYTDKRLCLFEDSITIQHYILPEFDLGKNDDTVCSHTAQPIVIAGTWESFEWTAPTGVTIPASETSWLPVVSGKYGVKVVDENKCPQKDQVNVTYVEFPDIDFSFSGDSAISCGIDRLVLDPLQGNTDYNYYWYKNDVLTDSTITYTPTESGSYRVIVSDKKYPTCLDQDEAYVTLSPDINILFEGDTGVSCFGTNYSLCADPGHSYSWTFNGTALDETSECHIPRNEGEYLLTVTDRYNCKNYDSIYVKYFNDMDLGLHGKDTIACYPYNTFTINVLGEDGYTYKWNPAVSETNQHTPVFEGDTFQTFKVTATNADGCATTDSINVEYAFEIKMPNIKGGDTTACEYAEYTIRPGGGFIRYEWSDDVAGPMDSLFVPKESGRYWVTVFAPRGGCKQTSDTVDVLFAKDRFIDLGGEASQCSDYDSLILDAGPDFERYEWENNPAADQQTYKVPFPQTDLSGVKKDIIVKGFYEKVCVAEGKKVVNFVVKNKLTLGGPDTTVCYGDTVYMAVPDVYDYYYWAHSENPNVSISNSHEYIARKAGVFHLSVTSVCGSESASKLVLVSPLPEIDMIPDVTICLGSIYTIVNSYDSSNTRPYKYEWREISSPEILGASLSSLPVINDGTYYAKVTDTSTIYQCVAFDTTKVVTDDIDCFTVPNLITPNKNDTLNNVFKIPGIRNGVWKLRIYNRWGDKIFQSDGYNNDWAAEGVSDGVYLYLLEHPGGERKVKGYVQVVGKDG